MIERDLTKQLRKAARQFPAVTLTGPRQSGKSTLCQAVFPKHSYANLEAPDIRAFASEDPRGFLAQYPKGAVLDEIQRVPELPSYLQGIIDSDSTHGRWIMTGSQNFSLIQSVNQSLAGRTTVLHLLPLNHREVLRFKRHPSSLDDVLITGGYPRIMDKRLNPSDWLSAYVATYIERDVRTISNIGDLATFQRFVELSAGRTSQLLNYSALAADCGISQPTAKSWMSVLEASFIAFHLPSFSPNIRKRIVKMPKVNFHDTGLACWLLGIRTKEQLRSHPLRGAIFETWIVSEIMKHRTNAGESGDLYHYRDQNQVEVDLIIDHGNHYTLIEAKAGTTIADGALSTIQRVRSVLSEVKECDAVVVYGGDAVQKRSDVTLMPWSKVHSHKWV